MFPLNDALDVIMLGSFLFGIVFTVGSLLLGVADLDFGGDHGADAGDGGLAHGMFNLSSILAFVTWFGGIGYVIRHGAGWGGAASIAIGILGGLLGAMVVGWFVVTVLRRSEQVLDPADYEQVGVIARVTSSIRSGGYGEIVFEQQGTRQVASARASGATAIPRGIEVVILRVERGVAIVEPFDSLLNEGRSPAIQP